MLSVFGLFQQLLHASSVMACVWEHSLHQLSGQQCHTCCIMLLQVHTSLLCQACPFALSYMQSNLSLDATVPTPSLDYANPIVCSITCSSPLLMQARCCQSSDQSQLSTDATGVADSTRDYKRLFYIFFIFLATQVSFQISTDANGVAHSPRDYNCLFSFFFGHTCKFPTLYRRKWCG